MRVHRGQDPGQRELGVCSELRWFPEALETFMSCVETDGGNPGEGPPAIAFHHKPAPGMKQGVMVRCPSVQSGHLQYLPGQGVEPALKMSQPGTMFATG